MASSSRRLVSQSALLRRVNRTLARQDKQVRKCRTASRDYGELGDYYCVDINRNLIVDKHVDLENYGRDLKVLNTEERLAN